LKNKSFIKATKPKDGQLKTKGLNKGAGRLIDYDFFRQSTLKLSVL